MTFSTTALAYYAGEKVLSVLLIIVLLTFVAILLALRWIHWFRQELKYINTEIERNTENKREQERWIRRKKRLWRSLLPGVKYE